jgi:hypothetical protein
LATGPSTDGSTAYPEGEVLLGGNWHNQQWHHQQEPNPWQVLHVPCYKASPFGMHHHHHLAAMKNQLEDLTAKLQQQLQMEGGCPDWLRDICLPYGDLAKLRANY